MRAVVCALSLLIACGESVPASISIQSPASFEPALRELVALTPYKGLTLGEDGEFRIAIVEDASLPAEAYQLALLEDVVTVRARDVLGAQYGAAAALEALGFRFRHPFDIYVPSEPSLDATISTEVHAPETRVRGFQLHTLHPIESYYAFWEPGPGSTNDAHRIIDWTIKNRGNYLQWVALDDIVGDPSRLAPWQAFTRELIDYAHMRGVRVGLNIQLFGASNLQQAYDLVDADVATVPLADQVAARLGPITTDLPFDVYDLSFGEFFNADPAQFIASVNEVKRQLDVVAPQAEFRGFIHVGAEQRIDYLGENLIYYFLIKHADPEIVHDVHTTMFYTLFDTASGAYHHDNFHEHRDHLFAQQCAGKKPGYVPETAYWIAFDNSVPQFLPLYVQNRWYDLDQIRAQSPCPEIPLDAHVIFSTGWEWSYWLHDVTALRASFELPDDPTTLVEHAYGRDLAPAVAPVMELARLQRDYLHLKNLHAYIASRDVTIDLGDQLDIVSQPDRVTFADIVAGVGVEDVRARMTELADYATQLDAIAKRVYAAEFPAHARAWADELRDSFEIDQLRVRFVLASYDAVLAHVDGDAARARQRADEASTLLDDAREVVARRHGDLHDTHDRRLLSKASDEHPNRTIYQYGYLYMADILCFWQREQMQVEGILGLTSAPPPGCLLP